MHLFFAPVHTNNKLSVPQKNDDLGNRPLIVADDEYIFNFDAQLDNAVFLSNTVVHIF